MFSRARLSKGKSMTKSLVKCINGSSSSSRSSTLTLSRGMRGVQRVASRRQLSTSVAPAVSVAGQRLAGGSIASSSSSSQDNKSPFFTTGSNKGSLSSLFTSQPSGMVHRTSVRYYSSAFEGVEVDMPALSPTMESGNIVEWVAEEGQAISPGDVLCRIETDKATMDFESPEEGYLAKILVPGGTDGVQLGEVIALIVFDEDEIATADSYEASSGAGGAAAEPVAETAPPAAAAAAEPVAAVSTPPPAAAAATTSSNGGRVLASPAAKFAAKANQVDIAAVPGTGPKNRVLKADVQNYLASGGAQQAAATTAAAQPTVVATPAGAKYTDLPISNIRKVIAGRLTESKQDIPHYYLTVEFPIDDMLALRKSFNESGNGEYKISVNDFVIKAASLSMKHVPEVNSAWMEEAGVIRQYDDVDVNVAVNTDRGLMIPLVTEANNKGLVTISNDVKRLAAGAHAGSLTPDEMVPGTFTVSNLGMFGMNQFTAVINPPQACILAVGGAEKKLVPADNEKGFATQTVMKVTLSCDHRVVDGAIGAEWLQHFSRMMKDPTSMLL